MGARAALAILASGSSSRRDAGTSEEQLRSGGSEKGPAAIPQRGEMGDVPPVAEFYGRTERPQSGKAIPGSMRRIFTMEVRHLRAVVNHYNRQFQLNLTRQQRADLVEFLKSL
jgi:hypothetical protein